MSRRRDRRSRGEYLASAARASELTRIDGDQLHTYSNTHPGVGYKIMEQIALAALAKL
jgi:hypothetical protein